MASHAYVPTAIELTDRIRVFVAFLDKDKHGRLGYIDVDEKDPTKILSYSESPILDDSLAGQFDSDGVTPLSIIRDDKNKLRLYYAGWQRFEQKDLRYTLLTGLAISEDDGVSFKRYQTKPIIKNKQNKPVITLGAVIHHNNIYKTWYAEFDHNLTINNKVTPSYYLAYMESKDGLSWDKKPRKIFSIQQDKIMGYGRSAVWFNNDKNYYEGLFPIRSWDGKYRNIAYSKSTDGISWDKLGNGTKNFTPEMTIDQQSEVCFPSTIRQKNRILMFYNGNNFGEAGLRLAIFR